MSFPISQNNENNLETTIFDASQNSSENKNLSKKENIIVLEANAEEEDGATDDKVSLSTKDEDSKVEDQISILKNPVQNPIWLSVSEAAKIGGVNNKTIRRAIQSEKIKYKIYKDRYLVGMRSLIVFLSSNKKLKNKLNFNGIGQYVKKWRD